MFTGAGRSASEIGPSAVAAEPFTAEQLPDSTFFFVFMFIQLILLHMKHRDELKALQKQLNLSDS